MNPDRIMACRIYLHGKGIPADDWLDEDIIKLIKMAKANTNFLDWYDFHKSLLSRGLITDTRHEPFKSNFLHMIRYDPNSSR